ncbi:MULTISPECIES: SymE family type I addiction module toxin [Lonsdalea]|uniref:Type I toxin-antitoxin system SymE family toxin n=1 Tax=Lonsdalea populi TaxID=1172565 RepID=A0A3N0UBW6_9GAMM|nr:type I toxin-antitoxin system SymE family toxin [Lonsdalea populi]ROH78065.1 type I toxin-antitoxin system SymE family toxin [Lonsdalea populi]ROH80137.1 type I toxin-antitoxin system SymE family toxin [Lonsdalea populi]
MRSKHTGYLWTPPSYRYRSSPKYPCRVGFSPPPHPRLLWLHQYSRSPSLHLKGHWLEAAGFRTDTPVVITVEHGQLLIRIVAE